MPWVKAHWRNPPGGGRGGSGYGGCGLLILVALGWAAMTSSKSGTNSTSSTGDTVTAVAAPSPPAPTLAATMGQRRAPAAAGVANSYVVREGDGGWYYIARNLGVEMKDLCAANGATPNTPLHPGMVLRVPRGAP